MRIKNPRIRSCAILQKFRWLSVRLVLVLLFISVERFSVSLARDCGLGGSQLVPARQCMPVLERNPKVTPHPVFLMLEQQHHKLTHVLEFPEYQSHFLLCQTISIHFQAIFNLYQPLLAMLRTLQLFYVHFQAIVAIHSYFLKFPVMPDTFSNIQKIQEFSLCYLAKGPWLGFRAHSVVL